MSPSIPVSSHLAPSLPGSGQEAHCTCDHVTRTGAKTNPVWRKVSHARKIRSCEGQQTVGWTMQLVIYIVSNNKSVVQISIIKFWRAWRHKRSDTCQLTWPCGVWGLGMTSELVIEIGFFWFGKMYRVDNYPRYILDNYSVPKWTNCTLVFPTP